MVGAAIVIGGVVAYNVLKLKLGAQAQRSHIPAE